MASIDLNSLLPPESLSQAHDGSSEAKREVKIEEEDVDGWQNAQSVYQKETSFPMPVYARPQPLFARSNVLKEESEVKQEVEDSPSDDDKDQVPCCSKDVKDESQFNPSLNFDGGVSFEETRKAALQRISDQLSGKIKFDLTCPCCEKDFDTKRGLSVHMNMHPAGKYFVCSVPGCEKAYHFPADCRKHEKRHVYRDILECEQAGCNKLFTRINAFQEHQKSHVLPPLEKKFKCGICFQGFDDPYELRQHFNYFHKKANQPQSLITEENGTFNKCKECSMTFTKWAEWFEHRQRFHPLQLLSAEAELGNPNKLGNGTAIFECDLCNYTTRRRPALEIHIAPQTSNCLNAQTNSAANTHINPRKGDIAPSGEIKINRKGEFRCELCSVVASDASALTLHRMTHVGIKQFPCDYCEYRSNQKHTLKKHIERHHLKADGESKAKRMKTE